MHLWHALVLLTLEEFVESQLSLQAFLLFVAESKLLSDSDIREGLASLLEELHDAAVDAPFAPKMVNPCAIPLASALPTTAPDARRNFVFSAELSSKSPREWAL